METQLVLVCGGESTATEDEFSEELRRGALSMANAGPNTNGKACLFIVQTNICHF